MSSIEARVYGALARIALLVPSPNTVAEAEFWRLAPAGVSVHTARMPIDFSLGMEAIAFMESQVPRVMNEVATAAPTAIAYGCTASSAVADPAAKQDKLAQMTGLPTVTAAMALLQGLAQLRVSRIALITPYPQIINDKERHFFSANGVEVCADRSVIVDEAQLHMRNMCLVTTAALTKVAIELGQQAEVEAVVLSCCDMPTLDAISKIESVINKPVISSTQALFWKTLRVAGVDQKFAGAGQLLQY